MSETSIRPAQRSYRWDTDRVLSTVIALSRFIRDNAHDLEFAARIVEYSDGARQVIPATGFGFRAGYRLSTGRDWLDTSEAAALRDLIAAFEANDERLPDRVKRAIWMIDWVSGEHYLYIALPLIVTAGEALTSTSSEQVMRQFSTRLSAIATELRIRGVSRKFGNQLYEARSQASHGARVELFSDAPDTADQNEIVPPPPEVVEKVMRLQTLLRTVLRKAIEDPVFAAHFADKKSVRARWPVTTEL